MPRVHVLTLAVLTLACAYHGVAREPYPMGPEFQAEGINYRRLEHLRDTAAKDMKCPADEIKGERLGAGTTYHVSGCGTSREYYLNGSHWRRARVAAPPDPSGPTFVQPYLKTVRCPACGDRVPPARFCAKCGAEMESATCSKCRTPLTKEMNFCPRCGEARTAQAVPPTAPPPPPPPMATEPVRQPVNPSR